MAKTVKGGGDVLVVVPCLNEAAHLPGLLQGLLSSPTVPAALVVVVDGGSTDGSVEIVQALAETHPNLRGLHNPKRLQSAGVNLAVRTWGQGRRWLVRVDAHAEYPDDYVGQLVRLAEQQNLDSVVTPLRTVGETPFQQAVAAAQNSWLGTGGSAHRMGDRGGWVDHGHHALFSLAAFTAVGGYDETFATNEDAELDFRLTRSGRRIWLAADIAVTYHPRKTAVALFRQYLRYGQGRARTVMRHRMRLKVRQALPLVIAPAALAVVAAPWLPIAALPAALWAAACMALSFWLVCKTGQRNVALAGVAGMTMHLAWSLGFWRQVLTRRHVEPVLGAEPGGGSPAREAAAAQ